MIEQLIEFETAKLAKENGFPQSPRKQIGKYREDGTIQRGGAGGAVCDHNQEWFEAPTQNLLQRWLREEHNIVVSVDIDHKNSFFLSITGLGMYGDYKTWEEALEQGLQEALKLIKI